MALSFYTNWPNYDLTYSYDVFRDPTFYETEINPIFDTNFTNNLDILPTILPSQPEFLQYPCNNYNLLPYSNTFDHVNLLKYNSIKVEESSNYVQVKKQENGGLSAQSKAARIRRRKISEKTAELGKLIPGGYKMNTAEMLQAAYKYIKYLQAQISVLQFMASIPDCEEVLGNGEMQALVTCTLMQQKLYTAQKCIGPQHFAETLANHH